MAATLLIVDVQEKLARAMPETQMAELVRAATVLLETASTLGMRVIVTEQYPSGLGSTLPVLRERAMAVKAPIIEKMSFSAWGANEFRTAFDLEKRKGEAVIVLGMEAHICVFQTVRDLVAMGLTVAVPMDGVASRKDNHRDAGLSLCREVGATITTTETVVFDALGRAGTEEFKKLSKLIR